MPGEERDLPAVRLLDQDRDGACLGHRLDDQDAGHDRAAGKVPGEPPVVLGNAPSCDDPLPGLELRHLVEQEKGRAVREDRLDDVLTERRDGQLVHLASLLGEFGYPFGAGRRQTAG